MNPHSSAAAVTGSFVTTAEPIFSKAVAPFGYQPSPFSATNFAAALLVQRHRVTPTRARLLVELVGYARKA